MLIQELFIEPNAVLPPSWLPMVALLYLGPETVMPLTSVLATIVGVVLMFWRSLVVFFKRVFRIRGNGTSLGDSEEA